jgi:dTDP-4-amino-4,6-dideoxygalactose transaminase
LYLNDRIAFLKEILSEISKRYDIKFNIIGTDGDHMHLFVNAPPRYSPFEIIRVVKTITARKIVERFPEIKKDSWGGEFWGDVGCFSMQANKPVFAGEGGFLITNNQEIYERAILLGHSGKKAKEVVKSNKYKKFAETGYGLKYRIHPLAAVIANMQFKKQDNILKQCEKNIQYYKKELKKFKFLIPEENEFGTGQRSYFSFVLKYNKKILNNLSRDDLITQMLAKGIQVRNDYVSINPLHLQKLFQIKNDAQYLYGQKPQKLVYKKGDFPISEKYMEDTIHLPPFVKPSKDIIDYYISALEKIEMKYT